MTILDQAHADMVASGEDDTARMRYFAALSTAEVFLVLEEEPIGEIIKPLLLTTDAGDVALAFDTELRMADFMNAPVAYVALSGRKAVALLAAQNIALGINLGAQSENFLPAEVLNWLQENAPSRPIHAQGRPERIEPPGALPEALMKELDARLAQFSGKDRSAYLVRAEYQAGESWHLLALIGLPAEAEQELAASIAEAVHYCGADTVQLDVSFHGAEDALIAKFQSVGLRFELPDLPSAQAPDPNKPPRLI